MKNDTAPRRLARPEYPLSPAGPVVDHLHGEPIPDPYRWLEPDGDPRVVAWTSAQNALVRRHLDATGHREALRAALDAAFQVGSVGPPEVAGGRAFWMERRAGWNQAHLLVRPTDGSEQARCLIDADALSPDGTTAIDWFYPSPDGEWLAYGLSAAGSEDSVLHLIRVEDGHVDDVRIPGTRHASLAWLPDGSGFYYSRYPVPGSRYWPEVEPAEASYHRHIYLHRRGTDPLQDERVFGEQVAREEWTAVSLSPDGGHLVATVNQGWTKTTVYCRPTRAGASWVVVADRPGTRDEPLPRNDGLLLFTNHDAPRGRVLRLPWPTGEDVGTPNRSVLSGGAEEIVAEDPVRVMRSVAVIGGRLVIAWLHDASSRLSVHTLDGGLEREVRLEGIGSIDGLGGEPDGSHLFVAWSSFAVPPRMDRLTPRGEEAAVFSGGPVDLDPSEYVVRLERAVSRDGTVVSMFVTHRRDLPRDGTAPAVLYGYGGFNHALTPAYSPHIQPFLAAGGVYAVAHLRGGGEYGEAWHKAGMLSNKENVFDDFEATADFLVDAGYTCPERLAVMGGSNGGLLAGAAVTRFPGKFRAAVIRVPLLDMLRYHHFLIARLWIPEYGDPDDPAAFAWLRRYSPYHNVPAAFDNPAVFILAAESDTRVAPLHARKFGAMLQSRSTTSRPILVRIEGRAGHGAGKPAQKVVDEYADIWAFLYRELGVGVPR